MLIIENILEFCDSVKLKNNILEFLDESLMCMFFYLIKLFILVLIKVYCNYVFV